MKSIDQVRFSPAHPAGSFRSHGESGLLLLAAMVPLLFAGCSREGAGASLSQPAHGAESTEHAGPRGKAVSVQTVVPSRKDLVMKFEQPAPLVACEEADLYARSSGYVHSVPVDIGDKVEKGQLLLQLEVPDLLQELAYKSAITRQAAAEKDQAAAAVRASEAALEAWPAQLEQAEADVKKAESEKEYRERHARRFSQLASRDATTPDLADEKRDQSAAAAADYLSAVAKRKTVNTQKTALEAKLEEAKADMETKVQRVKVAEADRDRTQVMIDYTRIKAPFSGIITRRAVDPGALVSAGSGGRSDPVLALSCIDKVTAVLRVPEREVGYIRVGTPARMKLDALGGKEVRGTVSRFSRLLDDKSRTMRVEIDIDNPNSLLYPGMYGPVTLVLQEIKDAITIPASAVYAVAGTSYVIQIQDGKARRVAVKTGYDDGKIVQVVEGLSGNEEIVVSNKGQIAEDQDVSPHRVDGPDGK